MNNWKRSKSVEFGPEAVRSLEHMKKASEQRHSDYVVADALRIYEWLCNNAQPGEEVYIKTNTADVTVSFPTTSNDQHKLRHTARTQADA